MRLVLVRHGQSEADILDVHEGRADFPLTELGREQAVRAAAWIYEHCRPEVIWSSPLQRAQQTSEQIQARVGCHLLFHDGLMEFNNGGLAGLSREEASHRFPEPPAPRGLHERVAGGESEIEFRARVELTISEILAKSTQYDCVAIVAHGGTVSRILQSLLKLPIGAPVGIITGDTGIHCVELTNGRLLVHFLNRTDHLTMSVHDGPLYF